jgi:hypothetical protein
MSIFYLANVQSIATERGINFYTPHCHVAVYYPRDNSPRYMVWDFSREGTQWQGVFRHVRRRNGQSIRMAQTSRTSLIASPCQLRLAGFFCVRVPRPHDSSLVRRPARLPHDSSLIRRLRILRYHVTHPLHVQRFPMTVPG